MTFMLVPENDCTEKYEEALMVIERAVQEARLALNRLAEELPPTGSCDGPPPEFDQVHFALDKIEEQC